MGAGDGPGAVLRRILGRVGIAADGDPALLRTFALMDRWGTERCRFPANRALALEKLSRRTPYAETYYDAAVNVVLDEEVRRDAAPPVPPPPPPAVVRPVPTDLAPVAGSTPEAPPPAPPVPVKPVRWACAVTTVPERRGNLLPRTLASLASAGFARPWLYVDGCDDLQGWRREFGADDPEGCVSGVTCRYPLVRAFASWCLALTETFYREPGADRYAVFQDDVECVRNLRAYLDSLTLEPKTYWNLWLGPWNENPRSFGAGRLQKPPPWLGDSRFVGFAGGDQGGRGAMALVFDRDTVLELIGGKYLPNRPVHRPKGPDGPWEVHPRGFRFIDGGVVDALKPLGYRELVHHPSLVRHTGTRSVMEKRDGVTAHDPNMPRKHWTKEYEGRTFPGTDFDAATWIR